MSERDSWQKKQSVLDNWFPRTFPIDELNYRLSCTREWQEYQRRIKNGEEEKGTRLTISQFGEYAIPFLLMKVGYKDVIPPGFPYRQDAYITSIVGSALHEARVLFTLILEEVKPEEVEFRLPTNKAAKNAPYIKALEAAFLKNSADEPERLEALEEAWQVFHKDPELVDRFPMEPLFDNLGLKDSEFEHEIRSSEEPGNLVYDPGRLLAQHLARELHPHPDSPIFNEVTTITNLKCGLQITCRTDSIQALPGQNEDDLGFLVKDLKTGKKRKKITPNEIAIDNWQAEIMILVSERFGVHFLGSGLLAKLPAYMLFNVNHRSQVGRNSTKLIYNWFDKKTGEVEDDEKKIEDRRLLNDMIEWLGRGVAAFKPYLKDYLKSGIVRENAGQRPSKKKIKKPNPYQQEFDQIMSEVKQKTDMVGLIRKDRRIYKIGVVDTGCECQDCGNSVVTEWKLNMTGPRFSELVMEQKCMHCGKVERNYEKVLNQNIQQ